MGSSTHRLGIFVIGLFLTGCAASQSWTTARTLEPGDMQHTVGVEALGIVIDDELEDEAYADCVANNGVDDCDVVDDIDIPPVPFPGYSLRIGVAENMEFGFKASTSLTLSADFKWQLVRSDLFDLALDPTIGTAFAVSFVQLPVMFSFNFGKKVTLTLIPKGGILLPHGDTDDGRYATALLLGGGFNVQIRFTERFALTPGFDLQRAVAFGDDEGSILYSVGLGFSFGRLPRYGSPPPAAI